MSELKIIHNIHKLGLEKGKKVYQCETCFKLFNWSDESSWYGSESDAENNPSEIKCFCSDKCRSEFQHLISNTKN